MVRHCPPSGCRLRPRAGSRTRRGRRRQHQLRRGGSSCLSGFRLASRRRLFSGMTPCSSTRTGCDSFAAPSRGGRPPAPKATPGSEPPLPPAPRSLAWSADGAAADFASHRRRRLVARTSSSSLSAPYTRPCQPSVQHQQGPALLGMPSWSQSSVSHVDGCAVAVKQKEH